MNFQSQEINLLFKLNLNQFETGFDQGLTWTDTRHDLIGSGFTALKTLTEHGQGQIQPLDQDLTAQV